MPYFREQAWSPYIASIIIGLLLIPAFLLVNTALGASSAFVMAAGGPGKLTTYGITGISFEIFTVITAIVLTNCLMLLENRRPWHTELGGNVDGLS